MDLNNDLDLTRKFNRDVDVVKESLGNFLTFMQRIRKIENVRHFMFRKFSCFKAS